MAKIFGLSLVLGLVCLLSIASVSQANVAQRTYLIKGRLMADAADVLVQLRQFLSSNLNLEQKCQRQAVALSAFKSKKISQFEVANIALARNEEIEKRYNQINVELMRNLYISAIIQYLDKKFVDVSLVDALSCLKAGFRNRDAKARSFLNNEELNTIVNQFETLMKQPLKLLTHGDVRDSGLNLNDMHETIKATVESWLGHDESKIDQLFGKPEVEEDLASENQHFEPEGEEQEYLETLFGSLIAVYESLPLEAKLGDRCRTYNKLIEANKEELYNDDFIDQVIGEVSNRITKEGTLEETFKPDKKTREDFLFVVNFFDPLLAGAEVWLDLNDCVAKWADEDEDVVKYLGSAQRLSKIDQLTSQAEEINTQDQPSSPPPSPSDPTAPLPPPPQPASPSQASPPSSNSQLSPQSPPSDSSPSQPLPQPPPPSPASSGSPSSQPLPPPPPPPPSPASPDSSPSQPSPLSPLSPLSPPSLPPPPPPSPSNPNPSPPITEASTPEKVYEKDAVVN